MGKRAWILRAFFILIACGVSGALCACTSQQHAGRGVVATDATGGRGRTLLDADWKFHLGDISPSEQVIAAAYDDAQWQPVDLPHDYVREGKYARSDEKSARGHGYLPYDVGWYRKRFAIPESARGRVLRIDFDGAFRDSQVWLNGKLLGRHPSGYTPFSYDITGVAAIGGENTLVVRVDPRQFEGWWYEGGGIYRHVYLTSLKPVHVAPWGTQVVSTVPGGENGADAEADVTVRTTLANDGSAAESVTVVSQIAGPDGKALWTGHCAASVPAGEEREVVQQTKLERPLLWSPESPRLYQLRTSVVRGGETLDRTVTNFGIRTLRFDADQGFFLNGKHVLIKGVACHPDFAGVGIAVPDSLQEWRVRQLKQMGCNGWRTAHNPPAEATLDACDRFGMLVMDENRHLGDAWTSHSPAGTTASDLSDLAVMVRRDRNHPSVIMWSMCNEEGLQGKPEGVAIFKKMMDVVHKYDQTRPITSAMNGGWLTPQNDADVEDIIGVNYNTRNYDKIHARHPDKMMFGSEDTNEKTTRGEYADVKETGMRSAYNLSEEDWLAVVNRPFMAGSYTWTGFDYKGEPNPYGWPDVSNNTGLLDLCGFPKDKRYYFQSCWSDEPMVHLVPANWNKRSTTQPVRVLAFSNAERVELFLNGKSLGARDVPHDAHAEWQVPYAPGKLSAKAYSGEKVVASDKVETTGAPAQVKLTTDRTSLRAGAGDAVVVQVSLLDDQGRVVPDDDRRITFHVTGGARILGVGNGNPADHDPDKAEARTTFHGRCMAVVQAGDRAGDIEVSATAPSVRADRIVLRAK